MNRHTLSVLVENKPGALTRVAALFARRGFNIHSLAVGPTEHEEISRITAVVDEVEDRALEQVTKQLNKLVNVLKIVELDPGASVQRELLMVKVNAPAEVRGQVVEIVDLFRAHIVDVGPETLVIEATGNTDKLTALMTMIEPFGVRELVKSGSVGIGRGGKVMADKQLGKSVKSAG